MFEGENSSLRKAYETTGYLQEVTRPVKPIAEWPTKCKKPCRKYISAESICQYDCSCHQSRTNEKLCTQCAPVQQEGKKCKCGSERAILKDGRCINCNIAFPEESQKIVTIQDSKVTKSEVSSPKEYQENSKCETHPNCSHNTNGRDLNNPCSVSFPVPAPQNDKYEAWKDTVTYAKTYVSEGNGAVPAPQNDEKAKKTVERLDEQCKDGCAHSKSQNDEWKEEFRKEFLEPDFVALEDEFIPKNAKPSEKVKHSDTRFLLYANPKKVYEFIEKILFQAIEKARHEGAHDMDLLVTENFNRGLKDENDFLIKTYKEIGAEQERSRIIALAEALKDIMCSAYCDGKCCEERNIKINILITRLNDKDHV